jgi:hypothetical protein
MPFLAGGAILIGVAVVIQFLPTRPPIGRLALICILVGIAGMMTYFVLTMIGKTMGRLIAPAIGVVSLGACAAIIGLQAMHMTSVNTIGRYGIPLLGVLTFAAFAWQMRYDPDAGS